MVSICSVCIEPSGRSTQPKQLYIHCPYEAKPGSNPYLYGKARIELYMGRVPMTITGHVVWAQDAPLS